MPRIQSIVVGCFGLALGWLTLGGLASGGSQSTVNLGSGTEVDGSAPQTNNPAITNLAKHNVEASLSSTVSRPAVSNITETTAGRQVSGVSINSTSTNVLNVTAYGAKCDGSTDDTAALNNTFSTASIFKYSVCIPPGKTCVATNLLFGNNAGGGTGSLSPVAIGTCGQGFYPGPNFGTLEASAGATGTFFKAHNLVQTVISNIEFNCNNNANISPCLDTSWGMIGPAPQDRFENVAVVNYAGVGWEASNDNETIFRDINVGNPVTANALTALNLTATGGTIMLENVYTEDAILDLAAQNGTLVGVNGYGIRFNKNGIGANLFTIIGGQQYNNPSNGNVFWDDSPGAPGHGAALTIQGMQVNMQQNGSIFDFRFGNKLALNELTVTVADGVAYNLLGPNVAGTTSGAAPQILCDSCTFPNTVSLNIPSGITYLPFSQDIDGVLLTASVIGGSGSLSAGSGPFAGTMTSVSASDNIVAPGPVCGNAIVATLSDRTNPSSAKVTAVSTTTFTFSATVGDTVDYVVGCR